MTAQTYIISLQSELRSLEYSVAMYLGPEAHVNNYLPTVTRAVESVITYGLYTDVVDELEKYQLSDESCEDIALEVRNSVLFKIHSTMGPVDETRTYSFRITPYGDLWLTDEGPTKPSYDDMIKEHLASLRETYDDGGYLTRHERRMIGV